jgi:nanoRNase/pAp phosphatase (c-di-AMP/oligoRNAs hydrolase)
MTAFVESCVETVTGSARQAERRHRHKPRARQLLRVLTGAKNILITTHRHPDPDALASSLALCQLLRTQLKDATITTAIKGNIGGGMNAAFAQSGGIEDLRKFEDIDPTTFDAIVLLDTQPHFTNSPLPPGVMPAAVIDHHRSLGKRPKCGLCDVRAEVGATSSIIFSYFMELEVPISRELGAMLLYAIESDLAGAAGTPGELDNVALSSLTLIADPRKLYRMRYVNLPQSYYIAYARGLENAVVYDAAVITHLNTIDSPEKPAVLADFLLRFDQAQWALATGVSPEGRLVLSMRTSSPRLSAADIMRRLVRNIGEGGGHRTKAGGSIPLETSSDAEIQRLREVIKRRLLRAIGIKNIKPARLVPKT